MAPPVDEMNPPESPPAARPQAAPGRAQASAPGTPLDPGRTAAMAAAILAATDVAFCVLDPAGRVAFANPAFEAVTGCAGEQLAGRALPPGLVPEEAVRPGDDAAAMRGQGCWTAPDGSRRCAAWSSRRLPPPGGGAPWRLLTFTDATAQCEASDALSAERDFVSAVLWTVPALVAVADPQGRIERFNKAFAEATGLDDADVRGQTIWHRIFQPEAAGDAERIFAELCARGTPMRSVATLRDAAGRRRQIAWHATVMRDAEGRVKHALAGGIDITLERVAVEDLRQANERLRELAAAMERVREDERRRIARELHDELGQALAGLRMDLEAVAGDVPAACRAAPPAGCEHMVARLERTLQGVDQVVAAVRRVSAELRPLILDDLGLGAAVEWLAENFAQRSGIACEARVAEKCASVPEPHATALFRILQESLTNIARHARARTVSIDLGCDARTLTMRIADDGVGIIRGEGAKRTFGVLGMRERAEALGGELRLDSAPGAGTVLTVSLPAGAAAAPAP